MILNMGFKGKTILPGKLEGREGGRNKFANSNLGSILHPWKLDKHNDSYTTQASENPLVIKIVSKTDAQFLLLALGTKITKSIVHFFHLFQNICTVVKKGIQL